MNTSRNQNGSQPPVPLAVPRNATVALLNETVGVGGAEMLIVQTAEELQARGRRVVVVLPDKRGWLTEQLEARGFPIYHVALGHPLDLRVIARLTRTLRSAGAQVLHSHEFAMAIAGTAAARALGCPHVTTMHGNQEMTTRLRRRVALRWAFRNSRAAVAVSEATRRDLATSLRIPAERIVLIRNGIPARPGEPGPVRAEFGAGPDTKLLLGVGSLVERKGYHVLLEALALLEREGPLPAWKLVLAGEGVERGRLEGLARDLGLAERVSLPGRRNDVADLQAAADVFLMPSLWEGLPLAVLEAMFAGTPVVAARTHGIPEAIEHEREGLLVPPGDVPALAAALRRVLTDPELGACLGAAALRRAVDEFSVARMVDSYEALYWAP